MKIQFTVLSIIFLMMPVTHLAYGQCGTTDFISEINSAWVASNHPLVRQVITNNIAECTNDLMATGLLYVYYQMIEPDVTNARNAAIAYVMAVSNRMPSEILHRRVPVDMPLIIAQASQSTNSPTNSLSAAERMQHLHYWDSNEFPYLKLFLIQMKRIEALESGELTEEDVVPFNQE